jgi:hypothetical protein
VEQALAVDVAAVTHLVPVPELRNVDIPFDQAPGLTELAVRRPV